MTAGTTREEALKLLMKYNKSPSISSIAYRGG
jgi:hypothetical protein